MNRPQQLRRTVADTAVVALFSLCPLVSATLLIDDGFSWWYVAHTDLEVGIVVAIAYRHRWPAASFVATAVLFAAYGAVYAASPLNLGISPILLAAPLSLWAVTRWAASKMWGMVGLVLGLAGALLNPAVLGPPTMPPNANTGVDRLVLFGVPAVIVMGISYAWAAYVRGKEEQVHALLESQLQRQRAELSQELHDVVGHGLTAIKVQAQTALYLDDQRDALSVIRDIAADSLADVRALVDALADGTPSADPATINSIISRGGSGIQVRALSAEEIATAACWPLAIRLALVRCVQEVTTNVIKHGTGRGRIAVEVSKEGFVVDSHNSARVSGSEVSIPRGLAAMNARAQQLGGSVTVTRSDGDFHVHVQVPAVSPQVVP